MHKMDELIHLGVDSSLYTLLFFIFLSKQVKEDLICLF